MTSSEEAVLTAWSKTSSWWGLQALCTRACRADSAGAARRSGHWQFRLPDFWFCSEESLLPLWEEVQIETTELCRHNLIYIQRIDLPWLIMAQEAVLRVPLHITGGKQSAYTLCQWYHQTKSKSIICMWQLVVKQTPFCLHTDFHYFNLFFFINPFFKKHPQKMPIRSQPGLIFTQCISLITMQTKCEITSFSSKPPQSKSDCSIELHSVLSVCSVRWNNAATPHYIEGCFIISEKQLLFLMPQATV